MLNEDVNRQHKLKETNPKHSSTNYSLTNWSLFVGGMGGMMVSGPVEYFILPSESKQKHVQSLKKK